MISFTENANNGDNVFDLSHSHFYLTVQKVCATMQRKTTLCDVTKGCHLFFYKVAKTMATSYRQLNLSPG